MKESIKEAIDKAICQAEEVRGLPDYILLTRYSYEKFCKELDTTYITGYAGYHGGNIVNTNAINVIKTEMNISGDFLLGYTDRGIDDKYKINKVTKERLDEALSKIEDLEEEEKKESDDLAQRLEQFQYTLLKVFQETSDVDILEEIKLIQRVIVTVLRRAA